MAEFTLNLSTLKLTRKKVPTVKKTRWIAIQKDGSRYTMHKKDGCWYYAPGAGAGPTIQAAIESAANEGITIIQESIE